MSKQPPEAYVIACLVLGEWERALAMIDEVGPAREYAPHLATTAARLMSQGGARAALEVAERAVAQDPECAAAAHALGQSLAAVGQGSAAEAALLRSIELNPRHLAARITLANLYAALGRLPEARRWAEEAVVAAPWDRSARRALVRLRRNWRERFGKEAPEIGALRRRALAAREQERSSFPPSLSLCLIVRDEAENLPRVVESCRGLATEVIVVDTGSTDDTVAVARQLGARVEHFPWVEDFAAARNCSLELATGEWIMVMDADDEFPRDEVAAVRRWLRHPAAVDVVGLYRRYPYPGVDRDSVSVHPWLFKNGRGLRFSGAIHEVLVRADGAPARPEVTLPVTLHHHGIDTAEAAERRAHRNVPMLRAAVARDPRDVRIRFYLGLSLMEAEAWDEAASHLADVVTGIGPEVDLSPKARACLGFALLRNGRAAEAERALREGLTFHPRYPDLWYALGLVLERQGRLQEAVAAHEQALVGRFGPEMAWHDWSARETRPHLALCDLKLALGDLDGARAHVDAAERFSGPRPAYAPIREAIARAAAAEEERRVRMDAELALCRDRARAGDPVAAIRLVEALLARGAIDGARQVIADLEPGSPVARIGEGRIWLHTRSPLKALACFVAARTSDLRCEACLGEAEARRALGQTEEAERALQDVLAAAPKEDRARLALADLYLDGGRWERAATCFQHLLAENHDQWSAWLGLGKAMLHLGQLPTAIECYQLAATLSGGHADVRVALGEAWTFLKR
jgi:tetratricopeptide (TPR) repeat protein